jgi:pimeloyl-ACP methyl ester carboxylesterase
VRRLIFEASPGSLATMRIVLLPGAYNAPEEFEREGFVDAVRERGLAIDLEFVAPDLQHLMDHHVLESLHRDVVIPAITAGCSSVWLGGVSLGGFIALAYAERWPDDLSGLCLLAPYLGSRILTGEVASAGGVRSWYPGTISDNDEERRIWAFIRGLPSSGLKVGLGIGRHDRFGHGHALLADALSDDLVNVIDGGHEWPVWRQLWGLFLDGLHNGDAYNARTAGA